jgi:hypothetical protein
MIERLPESVLSKIKIIEVVEEPGWGFQHKGYHLILQEVMDCDWLAMFDVDEYLVAICRELSGALFYRQYGGLGD